MRRNTVNQEIFTNDLFGEPSENLKFNPAKLYVCLKDFVFSVAWSSDLVVPNKDQSSKCQIKSMPIFPGLQYVVNTESALINL